MPNDYVLIKHIVYDYNIAILTNMGDCRAIGYIGNRASVGKMI